MIISNALISHQLLPALTLRYVLRIIFLLFFSVACFGESRSIVVFGDSVSAAYGIQLNQGWVSLLNSRLENEFPQYHVINASVSGETTGGGLIRLPKTLEIHKPDILILELGGNDGLRGYPISKIEGNLNEMIRLAQSSNTKILLIGMVLPPNYGRRYTQAYEDLFKRLARDNRLEFLPQLLDGVTTARSLLQKDGIHPKKEAQPLLLDNIWPLLTRLLE